jgi:hypothetical protein
MKAYVCVCVYVWRDSYVKVEDGYVDVVQELGVELDRVARREEDDDLLLQVLLQEREQQQEPQLRVADHVALPP